MPTSNILSKLKLDPPLPSAHSMFGQFIQIAIYPHLSVSTATFLIQFAPHLNHQNGPWTFFLTAIQLPEENFVNKKLPGGSPAQTHHSAFPCPWEKFNSSKESTRLLCLVSSLTTWPLPTQAISSHTWPLQGLEYSALPQEKHFSFHLHLANCL